MTRLLLVASLAACAASCSHVQPARGAAPRTCPEDIQKDAVPLEAGSRLFAGTWVAEFGKGAMAQAAPDAARVLDQTVELAAGRVAMVLGGPAADGPVGLVLREVADGACVVNAWGTQFPAENSLESLSSWTSADRKVAVFLAGVRLRAAPEVHWVAFATDGKRAWPALSAPGGIQFIAREAKLRPQRGKLFLDVKVKGPGAIVFAFRRDSGEFQRLN